MGKASLTQRIQKLRRVLALFGLANPLRDNLRLKAPDHSEMCA
jgi:hypothetical protein